MRRHHSFIPRTRRWLTVLAAVPLLGAGLAHAQTTRPLTMIVPTPPGSAPDQIARTLGDELRERLNQTIIIENRVGAGGIIAAMAAKNAPADGNTVLMTQAAVVTITPLTYKAANYDMETDFETIVVLAETPMLFVSNPNTGAKSLAELLDLARAKPNTLVMGSTARGSVPHLSGVLLQIMSGTQFNNIPMRDSPQAVQAVVSGDSQVTVDGVGPLLPLLKGGRVHALAVTAARPVPGLENVPLAKDTVPGLTLSGWFMMFAPKGTPPARVAALNAAANEAIKSPALLQKWATLANYPVGGSIAEARQFLAREKKLWAQAVQRVGLPRE